jgi:hypothetical protein
MPEPMLPQSFTDTRDRLHLVAARVLAAARYQAVGRLGLEVAPGGFATPEFDGRRLTVTGGVLGDGGRECQLASLGEACEFAGVDLAAPVHPVLALAGDADTDVSVNVDAAGVIANWYAMCQDALERLATASGVVVEPTAITLWPEHFDVALEAGPQVSRATYGGSPGDAEIAEPYLYIGPFAPRVGEFWNASFGAALTFTEVRNGADPLEFFVAGLELLSPG